MFLCCGYNVPQAFTRSTVIPLIKCKSGDLSDVNNYRAIALSNVISKFFEHLVSQFITSVDDIDIYQFVTILLTVRMVLNTLLIIIVTTVATYLRALLILAKHLTALIIGSYFAKCRTLLSVTANRLSTRLLAFWYSQQQMCVVFAGRMLRPPTLALVMVLDRKAFCHHIFFSLYIRDMIRAVVQSNLGCYMFNSFVNLLAYADDIILLAPSWQALQNLINILNNAADIADLSFNTKKNCLYDIYSNQFT